ncbi:uncharacterized [Tachysurus ichikawai]
MSSPVLVSSKRSFSQSKLNGTRPYRVISLPLSRTCRVYHICSAQRSLARRSGARLAPPTLCAQGLGRSDGVSFRRRQVQVADDGIHRHS